MAKKKNDGGLEVVDNDETQGVRKASAYSHIHEALMELEAGKALMVPIPSDEDSVAYRNKLGSSIRNNVEAPDGTKFRLEIQSCETKIAVKCLEIDPE